MMLAIYIEVAKHDELLRSDVLKDHSNARVAFHSYIRGQILQEKMSHMHGGKRGKIPLLQMEQISQMKVIH